MTDVKSKNPYDILGNEDSEEPAGPTKAIEKTLPRSTKKGPTDGTSGADRGGRGGRRGGFSGSEAAYNDRNAGSNANRGKPVDEGRDDRPRRGRGGPRGGRGGTFRDNRDDRHSKGLPNEHQKQADQSWGGNTGGSEWDDEKAGESIAKADAKDPDAEAADDAAAAEPEPEDNSKSWDDYMAEQANKRLNLGGPLQARKANEGSKQDKKWSQAKAISREEAEDAYIAPQDRKQTRQRERKEKVTVDIDHRFVEQPRGGERGGRGRGRGEGTRGRGEGTRGRGEGRGRGRGGADFRGGRGGGERGGERGGRGGRGQQVNVSDTSAFPTLGS